MTGHEQTASSSRAKVLTAKVESNFDVDAHLCGFNIVKTKRLAHDAFSAFGSVIEPPTTTILPSPALTEDELPPGVCIRSQGSALAYLNIAQVEDLYSTAPSGHSGRPVMSMFVCAPRDIVQSGRQCLAGYVACNVLERHPYTSQTFTPLGLSAAEQTKARYLVIVAPSLPEQLTNISFNGSVSKLNGHCQPDLEGVQAFIADGSQAVTYKAGTWHAPMIAIGKGPIHFVVMQYVNDVADEDCQEVDIASHRILASIPCIPTHSWTEQAV